MVRTWQAFKSSHPAMEKVLERMPEGDKPALVQELISELKSFNWAEQANAAFVLGQLGPLARPAVPAMVAALEARMDNVSQEIAFALPKIGAKDAVPELVKALSPSASVDIHEWHVMRCLAELGPAAIDAVPYMVPYLDNGANTGAVKALTKIGPSAAPAICKGVAAMANAAFSNYAAKEYWLSFGSATCDPLAVALNTSDENGRRNLACLCAQLQSPAINAKSAPALCRLNSRTIRQGCVEMPSRL